MASLYNTLPQDTYSGLIKFIDNTGSVGPIKQLTDGVGVILPMYFGTSSVYVTSISGSITGSFSGSLIGTSTTSSYVTASNVFGPYGANSVISSSYTLTSSYSLTASFALNAGASVSTASLLTTASVNSNIITFTKGDASTFNITVDTGSGGGAVTSITNNTNDYILTATGGTTINGEAQLRFNTSNGLIVSGASTVITAQVAGTSNGGAYIGSVSSNESGLYDLAGDTPMAIYWSNGSYDYTQYNTIYSLTTGKNGINTAYPTYSLDVNASGNTGARIYSGSLAVGNISASATVGRIDASNDVVAFSTSDIRLKENITPILNPIAKIEAIGGYTFDWKPEHKDLHGFEGHDIGVIAQEIEAILPEIVTTRDTGYKAVKYEKIVPLLIEAIKDLQKQIDELKSK
jgi:hypothetical protein